MVPSRRRIGAVERRMASTDLMAIDDEIRNIKKKFENAPHFTVIGSELYWSNLWKETAKLLGKTSKKLQANQQLTAEERLRFDAASVLNREAARKCMKKGYDVDLSELADKKYA